MWALGLLPFTGTSYDRDHFALGWSQPLFRRVIGRSMRRFVKLRDSGAKYHREDLTSAFS